MANSSASSLLISLLALISISTVLAQNVIHLGKDNITQTISHGKWLVNFDSFDNVQPLERSQDFSALASEWGKRYGPDLPKNVTFGLFNCNDSSDICSQYKVTETPAFLAFSRGELIEKIHSPADKEAISKLANKSFQHYNSNHASNVVLHTDTFPEFTKNGTWFVKFYSPKCGYSRRLAPHWVKMTNFLHEDAINNGIRFAEFDCLAEGTICTKELVDGYPTLFLYNNGKQIEEYLDVNEFDPLVQYYHKIKKRFPVASDKQSPESTIAQSSSAPITTKPSPIEPSTSEPSPIAPSTSEPSKTSALKVLDKNKFDELVKEKPIFIKFFSPTCSHCLNLAPNWIKLADELKDKVGVYEFDCLADSDFCSKNNISGYPTLRMVYNDQIVDYTAEREVALMKDFALKITLSDISILNKSTLVEKFDNGSSLFIYVKGSTNTADSDFFKHTKDAMMKSLSGNLFYQTNDLELEKLILKESDPKTPKLVALQDKKFYIYEGESNDSTIISEWIKIHKSPLVTKFDSKSFWRVAYGSNYMVTLILPDDNMSLERNPAFDPIIEAAKEYKTSQLSKSGIKADFYWTTISELTKVQRSISATDFGKLPAVAIRCTETGKFYSYLSANEHIKLDKGSILSALKLAFEGKLFNQSDANKQNQNQNQNQNKNEKAADLKVDLPNEKIPEPITTEPIKAESSSFFGKVLSFLGYIIAISFICFLIITLYKKYARKRGSFLPVYKG
ncbi:Thioredoxin domain-containing protein 5 [Smittium culicis]|uniref:Thioredoxin domain-containing protein 5 n=1 Tax=Smittium culicis TaxID=133412 RepID=A0A1R1YN24_9FUNG|nr:Thioredoxin domain-containing protein 5 [Smittium culicis]